jgi:hypothetical protein
MITLSILIVAIVLFAWKEAADDARAIAESNKTGKPFTHDDPDRYIVAGVFTLIMAGFAQTWWALLYFPITWAVFTISFRLLLNRKRDLPYWYISDSNGYDRFWLGVLMHVKYAAELVYGFEATILLASITIYITKTM